MKHCFSSVTLAIATVALVLSANLVLNAQNREKFVISAKAGGINAVSGRVEIRSYLGADWSLLNITDDLKARDVVRTGQDGRVEMLLNPGSYLRVGENSEFELTDNSLENLEVRLTRGTAIIEATGADETELAINITTPHARIIIIRRGLYRVNVIPGDTTELFVRKGRVMLANTHTKVKEGNKVVFSSTAFSVAKLQKAEKHKDVLDTWSKERAGTVALANNKISARDLNAFVSSMDDFWWAPFSARASGVWLFNPGYHCYTFMPFTFGWGSPYGSSYSRIFDCECFWDRRFRYDDRRQVIFASGVGIGSRSGPGAGTGSGSGSGSGAGSGSGSGSRMGPSSSPDWPGRSIGKPDTNPDGGRQRPPTP
ncbi:MAG: hypothetical protein JWM21_1638 [Acidobacteria bacterium]|nr:hypothetical protein [Acidobacteriota bacterium]